MFLIGGALNYFGIMSYKMIFGALLPLIILPFLKIRLNSFFFFTVCFTILIAVSAIINKTPLLLTLWYFQNVVIPFLMYTMVINYLTDNNIKTVYRWVVAIACIQLPIIMLQRKLYPFLSTIAAVPVSDYDIGFGTFYTSDDIALSFFVLGVILFLLFDDEHNYFIKNRIILVIWLTFTILVLNSKISYLILGLIALYYIVTKVKVRVILISTFAGALVALLAYLFLWRQIETNVHAIKSQLSFDIELSRAEIFYNTAQGNRAAALLYLSSQPLLIIGEGPHSLYNPITNTFNKGGDTGQLISFYVDLGLLGLITSYMMLYLIIRGLQNSGFTKLYLFTLFFISIVSNIFLDASIMMIFVIFCCSYLVPKPPSKVLTPADEADKAEVSISNAT